MVAIKRISVPQNLTTLAYNSIKTYILEGNLDEDTRLTEEFLSTQLGISKSPVREALNSLSTEGLIHIEARRGAYLRRFSIKEVKDLYDLREALEVFAVSVADISPDLIAELRASIDRTRKLLKANDKTGHIDEDARFHGLIANATGNAELCRVLSNVQSQIWLCRRKTYNLSSTTAPEAHQTILDAFAKNDRKTAQAAMRKHISFVKKRLLHFMEQAK
jgi:DNA-binding GntR family transcriptional regulator